MLEQSLPRGQARDRQARAHREVDVARQRREVACLDRHILRQGAVAMPVREAEHPLSHRQPRRAVAEGGDHSGQLVPGDRRCSVTVAAIGPGRGPRHLSRDESRRMNLNDDVVYRCRRLGPLHQRHPGRSRSLVRYHDCFHGNRLLALFVSLRARLTTFLHHILLEAPRAGFEPARLLLRMAPKRRHRRASAGTSGRRVSLHARPFRRCRRGPRRPAVGPRVYPFRTSGEGCRHHAR